LEAVTKCRDWYQKICVEKQKLIGKRLDARARKKNATCVLNAHKPFSINESRIEHNDLE
jgi:hypothetical protein